MRAQRHRRVPVSHGLRLRGKQRAAVQRADVVGHVEARKVAVVRLRAAKEAAASMEALLESGEPARGAETRAAD